MSRAASRAGPTLLPHVRIAPRLVEGEAAIHLDLEVSELPDATLRLVVDLYDAARPVHPEGHLGYWFRPVRAGERASLGLARAGDGSLTATLRPEPFSEHVSVTPIDPATVDVLEIHVALFEVARERNLWRTVVPWFRSEGARARRRARAAELLEVPAHVRRLVAPGISLPAGARVHVVAPDVRARDAVGNLAIDLTRWLHLHGVESRLWARNFELDATGAICAAEQLAGEAGPDDLVFYQLSIGDPLLDAVLALPGPRIAFYQGITPPALVERFEPAAAEACARGLAALPRLAGFDAVLAGSEFTALELRAALGGTEPAGGIRVAPPTLSLDRFRDLAAEPVALESRRFLLYVGRAAPHKRLEDLIDAYAAYRRLDPACELVLAGSASGAAYREFLLARIAGQPGVHWIHDPGDRAMKTLYQRCLAFVTASEHEGFCIPVVEAMGFRKPVLAHATPAVRQTLGGMGVLTAGKDPEKVAAAWHAALSDAAALEAILAAQDARLVVLRAQADGSALAEALRAALDARR